MAIDATLMQVGSLIVIGTSLTRVFVVGKSIVEVSFGSNAYSKDNEKKKGNKFSYGYTLFQQQFFLCCVR